MIHRGGGHKPFRLGEPFDLNTQQDHLRLLPEYVGNIGGEWQSGVLSDECYLHAQTGSRMLALPSFLNL